MEFQSLEERVIHYFSISYNKDKSTLNRDTRIQEDLGGKSLMMVGLVSLIEDDLDLMIPLQEAGKFKTIGEVIDRLVEEGITE